VRKSVIVMRTNRDMGIMKQCPNKWKRAPNRTNLIQELPKETNSIKIRSSVDKCTKLQVDDTATGPITNEIPFVKISFLHLNNFQTLACWFDILVVTKAIQKIKISQLLQVNEKLSKKQGLLLI